MKKFNSSILFFYLFIQSSCTQITLTDTEIAKYVWKCGQPCGIGDVLVFDYYTVIRNDTIIYNSIPIGKIVKRDFNRWTEDTKIRVINIQNKAIKDTCIYHAK